MPLETVFVVLGDLLPVAGLGVAEDGRQRVEAVQLGLHDLDLVHLFGRAFRVGLDEAGELELAAAAAGAGAGAFADGGDAALALADGLDDGALGHGVAVADLGVVEQFPDVHVVGEALGQHLQPGARQGFAALEKLHEPAAGVGLAEQDGADQLAVAQDQLLVDALGRVEMADHLAVRPGGVDLAHRRQVDAHHLQHGAEPRPLISRLRLRSRKHIRQHARLFVERVDKAVEPALVLHAFPDGEDARVAGAEPVVDDDTLLDFEAGGFRLLDVGPDAAADDDHVGVERAAVLEAQTSDAAVAEQGRGCLLQQHFDAEAFEGALEQGAAERVELLDHQVRGYLDDGDLDVVAE